MKSHARHWNLFAAVALTVIGSAALAADDGVSPRPVRTTLRDEVRSGVLTKTQARRIRADRRQVRIEHQSLSNANRGEGTIPPLVR